MLSARGRCEFPSPAELLRKFSSRLGGDQPLATVFLAEGLELISTRDFVSIDRGRISVEIERRDRIDDVDPLLQAIVDTAHRLHSVRDGDSIHAVALLLGSSKSVSAVARERALRLLLLRFPDDLRTQVALQGVGRASGASGGRLPLMGQNTGQLSINDSQSALSDPDA